MSFRVDKQADFICVRDSVEASRVWLPATISLKIILVLLSAERDKKSANEREKKKKISAEIESNY